MQLGHLLLRTVRQRNQGRVLLNIVYFHIILTIAVLTPIFFKESG